MEQALKKHAYSMTIIAQAMITVMGMQAENDQRKALGHSMAYVENDFLAVIEENGIHHNAILSQWIDT